MPPPATHKLGYSVEYQMVGLGEASEFAEYFLDLQMIQIAADTTSESNAGDYSI